MDHLVLAVLPFALGAAVSPTLLTLELLILAGKKHPKARAWMFVLGASVTILLIGLGAITVLRAVAESPSQADQPWVVALKAAATLVLVALGIRQLMPGKTVGERHHSRTEGLMDSAATPVFIGVGILGMLTNLSTIVLYVPAMHLIVESSDPDSTKLVSGVVLWTITILPIVLPVLAVSIVGHRSDHFLARVNDWTTRDSRQINAGLCFFFACLIGFSLVKALLP